MAELAGSIIGIVSAGTKVTLVLSQLASDMGSAGKEAKMIGNEIKALCTVLRTLGETMDKVQASQYYAHCSELIEDMATASLEMFSEVLDAVESLRGMTKGKDGQDGKFGLVGRFQWVVFKKPKIVVLRAAIEAYKSTLALMLGTLNTAEKVERRRSTLDAKDASIEEEQDQILLQSLEIDHIDSLDDLEKAELQCADGDTPLPVDVSEHSHLDDASENSPKEGSWVTGLVDAARDEISSIRSSSSRYSAFDVTVLQDQVVRHSQRLSVLMIADQRRFSKSWSTMPPTSFHRNVSSSRQLLPDTSSNKPIVYQENDVRYKFKQELPGLSNQQNTFYRRFRYWLIQQSFPEQQIITKALSKDIKVAHEARSGNSHSKPTQVDDSKRQRNSPTREDRHDLSEPKAFKTTQTEIVQLATRQIEEHSSNKAAKTLSIHGLPNGLALNLGNCHMTELPQQIIRQSWHYLEHLFLHSNALSQLPQIMVYCSHLRYLNLSSNNFEDIPGPVLELPNLEILDMSFNKLSRIPPKVSTMGKLEVLRLANNKIQGIPLTIVDMSSLQILDCTENPIVFPPAHALDFSVPWMQDKRSFLKEEEFLAENMRRLKEFLRNQDLTKLDKTAVQAIAGRLPLKPKRHSQLSNTSTMASQTPLPSPSPAFNRSESEERAPLTPSLKLNDLLPISPTSPISNDHQKLLSPNTLELPWPLSATAFPRESLEKSVGLLRSASTSALTSKSSRAQKANHRRSRFLDAKDMNIDARRETFQWI